MTADPSLAYVPLPRSGWFRHVSAGRLMLGVGRRLDLPAEYGITGDREFGWAGLTLGHLHLTFSWR